MNTVATPVSAVSWAEELQAIATRADALERNPDALLADRLDLATAAFSRLWLAWSPQVIARSCRASARSSPNRSLVRSKGHGAWIGYCYGG